MHSFPYVAFLFVLLINSAFGAQQHQAVNAPVMMRSLTPSSDKGTLTNAHVEELALDEKRKLWWTLTQEINKANGFSPFRIYEGPNASPVRVSVDKWTSQVAADLHASGISGQVCGETGDGHYLKGWFREICQSFLVMDKYDPKASVQLDLNLPPAMAPETVRAARGSVDLVVCHQVFEHLLHPTIGIANLNALLRPQGRLIFSTPFVTQDHQVPGDYFRYTVRSVHQLLQCAGFDVRTLRGFGNRVAAIAYLAGVTGDRMQESDLNEFCDGLTTQDCSDKYYTSVAAVGIKTKDVTMEEIHACFG